MRETYVIAERIANANIGQQYDIRLVAGICRQVAVLGIDLFSYRIEYQLDHRIVFDATSSVVVDLANHDFAAVCNLRDLQHRGEGGVKVGVCPLVKAAGASFSHRNAVR